MLYAFFKWQTDTESYFTRKQWRERNDTLFIYLFLRWSWSRRLNLCLSFCFSLSRNTDAYRCFTKTPLVEYPNFSKVICFSKEKPREEGKLLVPSNLHCYLDTFWYLDTRECSIFFLFKSIKTSYHQCMLHSRHKHNVTKSKTNENCYQLREQWFLPSVLPHSLSSERNTFSLSRGRPKIMYVL